jgi:hypothetical protein
MIHAITYEADPRCLTFITSVATQVLSTLVNIDGLFCVTLEACSDGIRAQLVLKESECREKVARWLMGNVLLEEAPHVLQPDWHAVPNG